MSTSSAAADELDQPSSETPCQLRAPAERRLATARLADDPRRAAVALTDLGIVRLRDGDTAGALSLFEEALDLVRRRGDRHWEGDILGNLGMALLTAGEEARATAAFTQELEVARRAGDGHAEKMALDHLAQAAICRPDPAAALRLVQEALALCRRLRDVRHETELRWFGAILHADLDDRASAETEAQAAIDLMVRVGKPHAAWYAEHLRRYRTEGTPMPPGVVVVSGWPAAAESGPSVLRQAVTATKALASFLGSGLTTVTADMRAERLRHCQTCDHHTGLRCRLCGCFTGAKAWLPFERCPIDHWPA